MDDINLQAHHKPITTSVGLADFCKKIADAGLLVLDTEFMREKTYYPQLCLIQAGTGQEAAIIDPLAPGIDLSPLLALITSPTMTKVFHAGRQDLDIFFQLIGRVPPNVLDTQIMAMALGFGDSVSYEMLVKNVLDIQIDKGARFTDWSQRPLSDRQLAYALSDVLHLWPVFHRLEAQLAERDRKGWVAEEMEKLLDPAIYVMDPDEAWRRMKIRNNKPRFIAMLKEICSWREKEAKTRNLPRQRILKDDLLLEIAAHPPESEQSYQKFRALPQGFAAGALGQGLYQAILRAKEMPKDQIPELPERVIGTDRSAVAADLVRVVVRHVSDAEGVAAKLLANSSDLDRVVALGRKADVPLLKGWRYDICGKFVLDLLEGKSGITLKNKDVQVIPLE